MSPPTTRSSLLQVLVGNKSDMDESKRAVPYSRGQALADEFKMQVGSEVVVVVRAELALGCWRSGGGGAFLTDDCGPSSSEADNLLCSALPSLQFFETSAKANTNVDETFQVQRSGSWSGQQGLRCAWLGMRRACLDGQVLHCCCPLSRLKQT